MQILIMSLLVFGLINRIEWIHYTPPPLKTDILSH